MGGNGPGEIRVCTRSTVHPADAVYHQACSVNFRKGKEIPKKHGNDTESVQRDVLRIQLNLKRS